MHNTNQLYMFCTRTFRTKSERTKEAIVNIFLSYIAKGLSILCSMLIVPLTINYVNSERYGIWLTLSSIISWIGFFDLGLGNGFRNKYAEAKANNDNYLAKKYVSTTYATIGILMGLLFLCLSIANVVINWSSFLGLNIELNSELSKVFFVLMTFFCLHMVVSIFTTLLTADQKPGLASIIGTAGQVLSLGAIYVLTKTTEGSLLNLALFYSSIPTLFVMIFSIYAFCFTKYRTFRPSIRAVDFSLIKNILNLGIQFFIIYLSMIFVFQIINIVISRELGPESVTEYNIAYKYFYVLHSAFMILVNPFWSSFTDAYTKRDIQWMQLAKKRLEQVCLLTFIAGFIMLVLSDWFYELWIGNSVNVRYSLSIVIAIYIVLMNMGGMYMILINGIGTIRIQLILYVLFAFSSYPLLLFFVSQYGLNGVPVLPTLVVVAQAIFGKIQIEKLLHGRAKGIWAK